MNILKILILLIHKHKISFHLFVSSSISFSKFLQFSVYQSFVILIKFIPRLFYSFWCNSLTFDSQKFDYNVPKCSLFLNLAWGILNIPSDLETFGQSYSHRFLFLHFSVIFFWDSHRWTVDHLTLLLFLSQCCGFNSFYWSVFKLPDLYVC